MSQPVRPPTWPVAQVNFKRLRGYSRSALRPDVVAGLSVAAYLIPQVMAYATLAGVTPVAGLWASLLPMVVYALLGTSRLLSIGPESTTAIMTAAMIAPIAAGDPERYLGLATMAAFLVGCICLLAGVLRVGFIASWLSRPVLIGYLMGVAVIMIAGQVGKLLGLGISASKPLSQIVEGIVKLGQANPTTLAMSLVVLTVLVLGSRLAPRLPWPLLGVLGAAAATQLLHLEQHGLAVVGSVPRGLPQFTLPTQWSILPSLLPALTGVAIVAYTDTMLTARAFAAPGEEVDADAELRALGLSNVAAGLSSGFPISSSGSRTALAKLSAAATPAYSLVTALSVGAVLIFGGELLEHFPRAALGALVVFAAWQIMEWGQFRWLWHFRRSEFWLGVSACLAVLVFDILLGIGVAVALSGVTMLARVARPHAASLGLVEGLAGMHDITDYEAREIPGLVVFRYDSPLFFANAEDFRERVLAAVEEHLSSVPAEHRTPVRAVLLNCEGNTDIDSTAVDALNALILELHSRGITLQLARAHFEMAELLQRAGVISRIGPENVFPTLPTAVAAFEQRHPPAGR